MVPSGNIRTSRCSEAMWEPVDLVCVRRSFYPVSQRRGSHGLNVPAWPCAGSIAVLCLLPELYDRSIIVLVVLL